MTGADGCVVCISALERGAQTSQSMCTTRNAASNSGPSSALLFTLRHTVQREMI